MVLTICEKLPKMKVCKKECFCFQCSLQFDSSSVFHLHLRLLHKESIKIKVKGNEPYINESFESEGGFITKSDVEKKNNRKKEFKCKICNYRNRKRNDVNM